MRGKLFSKSLQVGQGDFRCQYGGGLRQWLAEVVEDDAVAAVVDAVAVFTDTVYTNDIALILNGLGHCRGLVFGRNYIVILFTICLTHGATIATVGNATGHVVMQLFSHCARKPVCSPCDMVSTNAETIQTIIAESRALNKSGE
ncbi:MAG: hypothetical protein ACJA1T_000732 [Zhongshania aliphaticivorans]|jgi:hypothetical protein